MAERVRLNGKFFDWGSVIFKIAGKRFEEGITSIKYSQNRKRTKVKGLGRSRTPKGKTGGDYNAENLVVAATSQTAEAIREHIASRPGANGSYGDPGDYPITVQYVEPGMQPRMDELLNCAIESDDGGGEESPDPTKEELQWCVEKMKRNGRTLYSQTRS